MGKKIPQHLLKIELSKPLDFTRGESHQELNHLTTNKNQMTFLSTSILFLELKLFMTFEGTGLLPLHRSSVVQ